MNIFLSNTSSIPIRTLDEAAALGGRLVCFHFYNPPAVQRLIERIAGPATQPALLALALELAARLGKTVVQAGDTAGFIGNGHFIREGLWAVCRAGELAARQTLPAAVLAIDRVYRDGLLRPMGIFQLINLRCDFFRTSVHQQAATN
ncbi:MAG: hypothetical protein IH899_10435 [Planctomycetes bacterium]|nr:hypothetical protein [Planctomycetota bacterium]